MEFGLVVVGAKVQIHAVNVRARSEIAPASVIGRFKDSVGSEITPLHTRLDATLDTSEGTAEHLYLGALVSEAILHLEAQRTTDGVEAEHRVARKECCFVYRLLGDEKTAIPCGVPCTGDAVNPR